jgi:hypothetical protein
MCAAPQNPFALSAGSHFCDISVGAAIAVVARIAEATTAARAIEDVRLIKTLRVIFFVFIGLSILCFYGLFSRVIERYRPNAA